MRCPHCKTPKPTTPQCRVCGGDVAAAPGDELLSGLEPTRAEAVAVVAERLVDLETTEEVLGDTSIPDPDGALRCRRCGIEGGTGRFCEQCGTALRPAGRREPTAGERRCLACGSVSPAERATCIACGQRM